MALLSRFHKGLILLALLIATATALALTAPDQFQIRWNDEALYFSVAKNIYEFGDFNSQHYLTESLLRKGYPTKDTHPPGYPLLIAGSFLVGGSNERAPLILNLLLTEAIVGLLFYLALRLGQPIAGILSAILFLLQPLTLGMTHSMMSEISAAFLVLVFYCLLALLREGFIKGILLAMAIAAAALIKPFLLVLAPAAFVYLALISVPNRLKTLLGLVVSTVTLYAILVYPLTANREYYPSSINDLFLRPGLRAKLEYALHNLARNVAQMRRLSLKEGEAGVVVTTIIMTLGAGLFLKSVGSNRSRTEDIRIQPLFVSLLAAFLMTILAVFFIYEFNGYRGSRAIYCFSPMFAFFFAAALMRLPSKLTVIALAAPTLAIFAFYAKVAGTTLEKSKVRQTAIIYRDFHRTDSVLTHYGLKPKIMMSQGNLLLPALRFPTEVILSEPKRIEDFKEVLNVVKPDILELKRNSPLYVENLKVTGTADFLEGGYWLFHSEGDYFYYRTIKP